MFGQSETDPYYNRFIRERLRQDSNKDKKNK
jgi:hypothetical protein